MRRMPEGWILVRGAGPQGVNPNFFYLTGIAEPRGALLLSEPGVRYGTGRESPGRNYVHGKMARQLLFLPAADPLAARWGEDSAATTATVSAGDAGVDAVLPSASLATLLGVALQRGGPLHVVRAAPPALTGDDDDDTRFVGAIRRRFHNVVLQDASPVLNEMRRTKDEFEIAALERATVLTAEAQNRVMRKVRPGMRECELEAEIVSVYRAHGAGHAFDPIVGSGPNALKLHYTQNDGPVEAGHLLLVDTGAALAGYMGDITRTFPVDGKFTSRQREVYEVVLRAQKAAIAASRPGVLLGDLHAVAWDVISDAGYGEYFVHGLGHNIGLETHDVGDLHAPLTAGAVITIEPGIYIPEEQIGIRIEDDIVLTEGEPRVLSGDVPKEVEEIEAAMMEARG